MKIKSVPVLLVAASFLIFLGAVKIYAQQEFPTINAACEAKNGRLQAIDDGFSILKHCPKGSRRVVLIGMQGSKGDKGDTGLQGLQGELGPTGSTGSQGPEGPQGLTGATGPKGDPSDPGYVPSKEVNFCFDVSTGNVSVLRGSTCFPNVRWKIPVSCVSGEPCKPDNPSDPYYINNN